MITNIIIVGLPQSAFVGVDLLCFTSSPRFQGTAALPPGWHFLFTSPTASLSIRHRTWFFIPALSDSTTARSRITKSSSKQSNALVFQWSILQEELAALVDDAELSIWRDRLELNDENGVRLRRGLFLYHKTKMRQLTRQANQDTVNISDEFLEEPSDWPLLTAHLSHELLQRVTNPTSSPRPKMKALSTVSTPVPSATKTPTLSSTAYYTLTTSCTSPGDRDDIPGISAEDARNGLFGHEERELDFLSINLKKTWRRSRWSGTYRWSSGS